VLTAFFLGDRTRLVIEGISDEPLIVEASARTQFKSGQEVHVAIDPDALLRLAR